jgi:hypothetical protein
MTGFYCLIITRSVSEKRFHAFGAKTKESIFSEQQFQHFVHFNTKRIAYWANWLGKLVYMCWIMASMVDVKK